MARPAIHHKETASEMTPSLRASTADLRQVDSRSPTTEYTSQRTGPTHTYRSDVALMLPTRARTNPKRATSLHPPRRCARTVKASNHGRAAHGSSRTEIRPT